MVQINYTTVQTEDHQTIDKNSNLSKSVQTELVSYELDNSNTTLINIESNDENDRITLSTYRLKMLKIFLMCFLIYLIVFAILLTRNLWYVETEEENYDQKVKILI